MLHWSIAAHAQARRIALRAQWKPLMRRARRGKNVEAFLNMSLSMRVLSQPEEDPNPAAALRTERAEVPRTAGLRSGLS